MMHAENGMAIDVVAAQTVDGRHDRSDRPRRSPAKPIFEGEATNRVIRLAEAAGVPVYIVHLSARDALDEVRARARPRLEGVRRDVPAVPVPVARRPRQRVRGREVRLLAAAPLEGPLGRPLDGPRQGRPPARLDRPLPVRLPRPEGARAGRLPQGPQRPARRRGPGRPAPRRRRRRRPDHAASAGSRSSRRRRRSCSGCTRRRARSPSARTPTSSSTTRTRRARSQRDDPPHGRRLLVLRGPRRSRARSDVVLSRGSVDRPRRRVHRAEGRRQVRQARAGRLRPALVAGRDTTARRWS